MRTARRHICIPQRPAVMFLWTSIGPGAGARAAAENAVAEVGQHPLPLTVERTGPLATQRPELVNQGVPAGAEKIGRRTQAQDQKGDCVLVGTRTPPLPHELLHCAAGRAALIWYNCTVTALVCLVDSSSSVVSGSWCHAGPCSKPASHRKEPVPIIRPVCSLSGLTSQTQNYDTIYK